MQTLAVHEIDQVAGGDSWGALVGTIAATIHEGGVYGAVAGAALAGSFWGGWQLGSAFNSWFESSMGESFGGWLYDVYHQPRAREPSYNNVAEKTENYPNPGHSVRVFGQR